jgi:hypothetical protein
VGKAGNHGYKSLKNNIIESIADQKLVLSIKKLLVQVSDRKKANQLDKRG